MFMGGSAVACAIEFRGVVIGTCRQDHKPEADVEMTDTASADGLSRPELWGAICRTELHVPIERRSWRGHMLHESFADRLMKEHSFTEKSANRLEFEYRRFLYLKAIDGGRLTPSARVDQAWHLHLDTDDSFAGFCDKVGAGKIEHFTGLAQEEARAGYQRTLSLYHREFGQQPPPDIWPTRKETRRLMISHAMAVAGFGLFIGAMVVQGYVDNSYLKWAMGISGSVAVLLAAWIGWGTDLEQNCG